VNIKNKTPKEPEVNKIIPSLGPLAQIFAVRAIPKNKMES